MVPGKLKRITAELQRVRQSSLARNAGWMLVGQGASLVLQAGYFILLARLLGVREYGIFAGAFAFAAMAAPYSALGSGLLFMRYVSSNRDNFAAYWGHVLLSTVAFGSVLTLVLYFLAPHLLNPASASIVLLVALGHCVFTQLVVGISQVFQAFEQLRMTAMLTFSASLLRLLAVAGMALIVGHGTARQWAVISLFVSIAAVILGVAIVTPRFGLPRFSLQLLRSRMGEGFGFSFAGSTQSVYNDLDKAMLSHYGMNAENGFYTMAYRIVDLANIPITALDAAALPRYFRQSAEGYAAVRRLARSLAKRAALVGLLMAILLFVCAPLIPRVFGGGFASGVSALRWLCLLPALRGIHQLTGSAITGMGFQRYRTAAQFFTATLNFALNLWLIPAHTWQGAAWASLATDGTLVLLCCITLGVLLQRKLETTPLDAMEVVVSQTERISIGETFAK